MWVDLGLADSLGNNIYAQPLQQRWLRNAIPLEMTRHTKKRLAKQYVEKDGKVWMYHPTEYDFDAEGTHYVAWYPPFASMSISSDM